MRMSLIRASIVACALLCLSGVSACSSDNLGHEGVGISRLPSKYWPQELSTNLLAKSRQVPSGMASHPPVEMAKAN